MSLRTLSLVFFLVFSGLAEANGFGEFIGKIVVEWLDDGRRMKLTEPFAYISPSGTRWDAPAGSVVDGASIPQFAWSIIGGPFEGKYRNGSVIHDVACISKNRPWQTVHEALYTAMLASGVNKVKAKIMYAAVYYFGPRWPRRFELNNVPLADVDSKIASVSASADINDGRIVDIRPRTSAVWGWGESPQTVQPTAADVTVTFVPPPNQMSQADFDELKKAIEFHDLSLEAIRSYRAAPQAK